MASLTAIRTAVKTTLEAVIADLVVHPTVPDSITVDSAGVVVRPPPEEFVNFNVAMGRGSHTYQLDLIVLANFADAGLAQEALDAHITGAGPKSICAAIFSNRTLGLSNTDAHISSGFGYGAQYEVGSNQYVGAALRLVVTTKGTE